MYLLSFFLSIGTTVATFPLSRKVGKVVLLFMTIDKVFERTSESNLTNLIGNLSVPAAFFEFKDFNIFSTSSEVTRIIRDGLDDLELRKKVLDTRKLTGLEFPVTFRLGHVLSCPDTSRMAKNT